MISKRDRLPSQRKIFILVQETVKIIQIKQLQRINVTKKTNKGLEKAIIMRI